MCYFKENKILAAALIAAFFTVACSNDAGRQTTEHAAGTSLQVPAAEARQSDDTAAQATEASNVDETATLIAQTLQRENEADLSKNLIDSASRQFIYEKIDLNNGGEKEILVGMRSPYFCGSGGCTVLLLDSAANVITRFTVVKYPLIIDSTNTRGWKNLIIYSGGKYHRVRSNGKKYPSNPSVQPRVNLSPDNRLHRVLDVLAKDYPTYNF